MNLLLELALRGSAATLIVIAFDRSLAGRVSSASRRFLWCVVPLAFLAPLRIPVFPRLAYAPPTAMARIQGPTRIPAAIAATHGAAYTGANPAICLWLAGMIAYAALVTSQTVRASRRWSREPLSTDPALLALLEACKREAGVTAPIGLVISASISSPAILGWLRPRILLPAPLAAATPVADLRPILLHELAHFRWLDVPFNWLLTLVRAVHWFNPLAHLGARAWTHFREEAADETALRWMRDASGRAYGDALVRSLRVAKAATPPFGAFAIIESIHHLKRRIEMINRFKDKSPQRLATSAVSLLLCAAVCSMSAAGTASSDPRDVVAASVDSWLKEIDAGQYDQSWRDSSAYFRDRVSMKEWEQDLKDLHATLGTLNLRDRVSMAFQKGPPSGSTPNADTVVVQYDSSYQNQKYSFETLYFMKEADGNWRATGYFVHPR